MTEKETEVFDTCLTDSFRKMIFGNQDGYMRDMKRGYFLGLMRMACEMGYRTYISFPEEPDKDGKKFPECHIGKKPTKEE